MVSHATTEPAAIRPSVWPSPRLAGLAALAALGALAAVAVPMLIAPAAAFIAAVVILALIDLAASRGGRAPRVERAMPRRFVKGRNAPLLYRFRAGSGPATISLLDELPAALGGDLLIDNLRLAGGESREVSREVMPLARGSFALGPVYVLWSTRLGLFASRRVVTSGGSAAILPPAAAPAARESLTHRSLSGELGLRPRPARGEGSEFESLREYAAGDDPRHVDWKASARRGRMMVRQYQTERRHTVLLALDTGRLMAALVGGASKLDHALDCAIALARASREYGDRVGLLAFDRELRAFATPRGGAAATAQMAEAALRLKPSPFEPDYRVLVETLAARQKKRALVVVLTDFVEGGASRELANYLRVLARRHLVLLVALRDRLLAELDQREPAIDRRRLYARLALQDLVVEREAAIAAIARFAHTLDLDAGRINAPVLNRYLAIRRASMG